MVSTPRGACSVSGEPPGGIAVFEASARTGGRLFSMNMPGTIGIAAEFGRMRFLSSHTLITSVAAKFGLEIREFATGGPENIFYARGKQWRAGDIAKKQPIPYGLRPDELYL